jgi:hypothetical protein
MCVVPGNREQLRLVADGTGGAFAGWVDYRRGNDVSYADIYSQRIDSTGVGVWDVDGVPIDIGVGFQSGIRLVQNDPVGMALVWTRYRGESAFDIFGQMVDPVGKPLWAPGGIPVASIFGNQQTPAIDSVGDGTVIVIWEDDRNSRSSTWETISELDIYGQRMDPSGAKLWAKEGIPICVASRYQFGPVVTANAAGGAIVAWSDERASGAGTERDIYAQSVGQLGEGTFDPTPHIQRVVDVSSDQGGRVSLEWVASSFDYSPNTVVTHYSIWRSVARLDDGAAMNSIGRYVDLEDLGNSFQGPAYMVRSYGGATYVWEWLDNRESHYFDAYAYTTPTLYDSTRAGPGYHYFLVAAHTEDPFVFWDSAPDSGYSVDNLAPRSPQGLAGHYDSAPDLLTIHWHANTESDLSGYRVYRGEGADFVPSDDNLIAATPDTVVSGLGYFPADPWFIKISAVDIHGNESGFAMLPPEYVTIATFISRYGADWVRGAVEVSWSMMDEGSQFEFRVLRKAARDDQYTELACEITGQSTERLFRDATAEAGKTYSYRVLILDDGQPVTSFETSITTPPYELALYQNYPNPLNPSTRIDLTLDADGPVSLRIYDISGRIVRTVLAGDKAAGTYTEEWDGRNDIGNDVASGIYFIRLTAGNRTLTRKAVLVR